MIASQLNHAATITLTSTATLNALTLPTLLRLTPVVTAHLRRSPNSPSSIILRGTGRAFCAGGDVAALYSESRENQCAFFRREYLLDLATSALVPPLISHYHGVVMGGGVGISAHGTFRLASNRALFAMPEVGIGLFPDVGGGYLLPRLPQPGLGVALALSGLRLTGAELAAAGIATHYIPDEQVDEVLTSVSHVPPSAESRAEIGALLDRANDGDAVARAREQGSPLLVERDVVQRVFGTLTSDTTPHTILAALDEEVAAGSEAAAAVGKAMRAASPTSVAVVLEQMRRGATMSLADVLAMEFGMVQEFMANRDFYEGVRAALIDKDKAPVWQPAPTAEQVAAYFATDTPGRQTLDPIAELHALSGAPAL